VENSPDTLIATVRYAGNSATTGYHIANRIMLWTIFFIALAIRWGYAILIFALMGDTGLQGVDSIGYLADAHNFAAQMHSGSLTGLQWLGPLTYAMPLFQWLMGLCALLFGRDTPLAYVLLQGIFDAGTCLLICGLARTLNESYAAPAGFAAAFNSTQIVLSGLVYTDTPFLFFSALFLFAAACWLRTFTWKWAALIGLALGAATLTRAFTAPFAPILLLFLVCACAIGKRLSCHHMAQLAGAAAMFSLCVAPVLWRNVSQFGTWSLTPQTGMHLAQWVMPLVKEARDGTPWARSYDDVQRRTAERYLAPAADLFEQSRRYTTIAREGLAELGVGAMANAWSAGAAINLASPAIILSPPVSQLPRTGFYAMPGASPVDKVSNFLFRSDNSTYAWILLAGIIGVLVARVVQLIGLAEVLRHGGHLSTLCLFGLWIAYVLAINGPVASPKYRLPIEPPLMVLTGAGLCVLVRRWTT
jgi:4-amino-4-deoxy-L-arabinose transferase-like glycosyltransferase